MPFSRRLTLASAVGAAVLTACQLFLVLENKESASSSDGGQGAGADAAREDGRPPGDAALVVDAGPVPLSCPSDPDAAFCSTFDDPDALAAWSLVDPGVLIVDGGVSPPGQALMYWEPGPPCTASLLHASFKGTPSSVRITAQVRLDSNSSFVMVTFRGSPLQIIVGFHALGHYVEQRDDAGSYQESKGFWQDDAASSGRSSSVALHLTITPVLGNSAIVARLGEGGSASTITAALNYRVSLADLSVHFGPECSSMDASVRANVWVDDVKIWLDE